MTESFVPIFRVTDASKAAEWYARLGFVIAGEHRFAPTLPLFLRMERNGVSLYLSEHKGDAPKKSLAYFWVDDVDAVAGIFSAPIHEEAWAREITLTDPDGNRLRIATATNP